MSASTWHTALAARPEHERVTVLERLNVVEESAAFGNYTIRNLTSDRFLCTEAAEEFIELFLRWTPPSDPLSVFKQGYINVCWAHSLCGGEIRLPRNPENLGRAVEKPAFLNRIGTLNGVSKSTIQKTLHDLEAGTLSADRTARLRTWWMSAYPTWVTWDRESTGADRPFAFMRADSPYDLRNALGLPITPSAIRNVPMLGFEYKSLASGHLYRATTADAAESLRFQVRTPPPPPDSDWYGLTVPWQDDLANRLDPDRPEYPPKRPEALHKPIQFPDGVVCVTYPRPR